jgi:hypothetical protein
LQLLPILNLLRDFALISLVSRQPIALFICCFHFIPNLPQFSIHHRFMGGSFGALNRQPVFVPLCCYMYPGFFGKMHFIQRMISCISSVSVEGKLNAPTDENSDFEYKQLILEII